MIDISDGLVADLRHVMRASRCSAIIDSKRLPISQAASKVAEELKERPADYAMFGGEDYRLLFTVEKKHVAAAPGHMIGKVTKRLPSKDLIKVESYPGKGRCFEHFI